MLKNALPSAIVTRRLVSQLSVRHRTYASATSAEKRALNKAQIKGGADASSTTATTSPPPPSAPQGGGGGGGDSSLPYVFGGVALIGVGVAAYSNGMIPGFPSETKITPTTPVKEAVKAVEEETTKAVPVVAVEEKKESKTARVAVPAKDDIPSIGNRVVTIVLPEGTRRSSAVATPTEHPVDGNRVEMSPTPKVIPVAAEEAADASSSASKKPTVDSALQELRGQLSQESSITLQEARQELAKLSSIDATELDTLTPTQLKIRLIQLSKDLEERTKWEAVRLKEFLAMKEQEVQNK